MSNRLHNLVVFLVQNPFKNTIRYPEIYAVEQRYGLSVNMSDTTPSDTQTLAEKLEADLIDRHGPLLTGQPLHRALGYRSAAAFRQAVARNTVPVPVFSLENRRGKYALATDVADWLAQKRQATTADSTHCY